MGQSSLSEKAREHGSRDSRPGAAVHSFLPCVPAHAIAMYRATPPAAHAISCCRILIADSQLGPAPTRHHWVRSLHAQPPECHGH